MSERRDQEAGVKTQGCRLRRPWADPPLRFRIVSADPPKVRLEVLLDRAGERGAKLGWSTVAARSSFIRWRARTCGGRRGRRARTCGGRRGRRWRARSARAGLHAHARMRAKRAWGRTVKLVPLLLMQRCVA